MKNKKTILNDKDLDNVNGGMKFGDGSIKSLDGYDVNKVYCTYYKGLEDENTRACSNCPFLSKNADGVFCTDSITPNKTH